ncbi:MAG: cation diffusion facilitator family transporter [Polyangiaceae bacterium]|nr:cation diffusion facilitator family transporter [Polyangiaceae bacterium]
MSDESHSTSHIIQSLVVNLFIAVSKFVAAFFTKSGAMLAEAIHSSADCANQLLLLLGVKLARRAPDPSHPMGYGREVYFWSFMVAMLLFTGGGVFSVYEGIHKILHPEPVENLLAGVLVLGISLLLEGASTFSNIRELNKRRKSAPFVRYLQDTKDSDLIVVFGENSAATIGLTFALCTLVMAYVTGNGMWDGIGSLLVGLVLIGVAVFLAIEVKSLLVGEAADPTIERAVHEVADKDANLESVLRILTIQQGPGEVMLAMKVKMKGGLSGDETCDAINAFEQALQERHPEIRWCFVEPDNEA